MNAFNSTPAAGAQTLSDPALRRAIVDDPRQYAVDNGLIAADAEVEVKVTVNDANTLHIPLPRIDSLSGMLSADELESVSAGGYSTVGTAACASTFGCANGTLSTGATAGTVGSGAPDP